MEGANGLLKLPSKFSVSAPGKVILHGEHSVVYGHLAIAASLNLRTKLEYALLDSSTATEQFIKLIMPCVGLEVSLSPSSIDLLFSMAYDDSWDYNHPQNVDFNKLLSHVQDFVNKEPSLESLGPRQQLSVKTSLFLMVAILNHPNQAKPSLSLQPFQLQLSSELPVGAGAGSSGSFCVSLAAVFICIASLRAEPKKCFCLDEKVKDLISNWAFLGEKITHGNPSGLDNSICTFGSLMSFRRPNSVVKIPLHSGVRVLLVDTKVSRNTKTLVEQVATLKGHHEVTVNYIMQAMDSISVEAEKIFKLLDESKRVNSKEETTVLFSRMEELWSMNHSLLVALGVSHPSLDRIIQLSTEQQLCGKLTGAGGGGFAIILVPINAGERENALTSLKQNLTNCGFDVKDVELGGPGIQLHTE